MGKLCDRCVHFDVRAVFVAAKTNSARPGSYDIVPGTSRFFQLQPNLRSLYVSAAHCDLCSAIWTQIQRLRHGSDVTEEEFSDATSVQPVYLDLDDWEPGRSRSPLLVAVQYRLSEEDYDEDDVPSRRLLAELDVCATPWKEPEDHQEFLGTVQATAALKPECLESARSWLERCSESHSLCRITPASLRLPARVLDVATNPDVISLVDGSAHTGHYAALSYCWGGERDLVLDSGTHDKLLRGISPTAFPATLRDAITVTQRLGLRFLWIDAVCIFQDSREDWANEAARMAEVYRGSMVTIEAASATKASDGFSAPRQSSQPYTELAWRSGSGSATVQLRPIQDILDTQLTETKIFTRGWTLQERLLSPRTLSFGEQQMSFECATGYVDEAGTLAALPRETEHYLRKESMRVIRAEQGVIKSALRWLARSSGVPRKLWTPFGSICTNGDLQVSRRNRGSYHDYWRNTVQQFAFRELGYETDRLPALSGVARELQRVTGDTYCAGLWWSELLFSLAWEGGDLFNAHGRFSHERGPSNIPSRNIAEWPAGIQSRHYVAPSWSWASVKGRISFMTYDGLPRAYTPLATVIRVTLRPQSGDPFGVLSEGLLDIKGPVLRLPSLMVPCERSYAHAALHDWLRCRFARISEDWCDELYQHHVEHEAQQCALLKLFRRHATEIYPASVFCLLLETCGNSTWRRLSLVELISIEGSTNAAATEHADEAAADAPNIDSNAGLLPLEDDIIEEAMQQCDTAPWKVEQLRLV